MTAKKHQVANLLLAMTYNEIMEVADGFSEWTSVDDLGNQGEPTIDRDTMAANLIDWAETVIAGEE